MRRTPFARRAGLLAGVLALVLLGSGLPAAEGKGSVSKVEDEFEKAIKKVTPATVVCLPWGIDQRQIIGGSSGVIMSRKGLVLSDGDVGIHLDGPRGKGKNPKPAWSDDVEIRMPSLKGKGFTSYRARVIRRNRDLDTSLLRIEKPPSSLKYLKAGNSDELKVGDFTFAMGNSFGLAAEAPPTLTAGVVASLTPGKEKRDSLYEHIYTSAAVNQGVNGGPLVDIHGHLVGTISSAVSLVQRGVKPDDPRLAYAYLGKVVPVERLRAHYADLPEHQELFPDGKRKDPKLGESGALAAAFHGTARRAYSSVVSLGIKRKGQLSLAEPSQRGMINIPRYLGPVSGVLISEDGFILTSLYNLANLVSLVNPGLRNLPDNARVQAGVAGIEAINVFLPGGDSAPAKIVARHEGLGLVLLKAEFGSGDGTTASAKVEGLVPATPAPKEAFEPGRFVLSLGNPFGENRLDDPLLTVGVLSKQHVETSERPWAGLWQTDAGITDANAGGAAVDLRGRLLGITTIWSSTQHGRNSGIGFIVPWTKIEPVLAEMKRGREFRPPLFGLEWVRVGGRPTLTVSKVSPGSAAEKAGVKVGDTVAGLGEVRFQGILDFMKAMKGRWSGDQVVLVVKRDGKELRIPVTLGARE